MRLAGKVAIITGAGSGIGRAAALRFAKEGASVLLVDHDERAVGEVHRLISGLRGDSEPMVADVSAPQESPRMAAAAIERFGKIDILYNNAAVTSLHPVISIPDDELERVFSVNVKSIFYTCRAVLPSMLAAGHGVILNNASITGLVGAPGMAAYATSKGAIITFTRTLALEQAEAGIRVNCICPASIDTDMLRASFEVTGDPEKARANNIRRHPLGRLGTPEDVASLALFLASDEASFITGGTYVIDGGATLARRWRE
jgi:NAD(P)-dependent dehydrogenase (short-subunit alcohol dehydrogenase family)